jgi:uncharacterized membrane protein HdeD (DUF308 family)
MSFSRARPLQSWTPEERPRPCGALTVPTALVIILGVQGFIMGVLDIIGGFKGGGLGSFVLGVINILVGLLLLGSPLAAALAVPLVFGILLLIQGVGLIIWAFRVRV